jgi:GH25 family lysozyme M1 (1,4-beta-N-acetylmuramidase)
LLVPPADAAGSPTGPDVSRWQHDTGQPINWSAVKGSGQSFTFMKATQGTSFVDPWFAREWAAAGRAGLVRGAYHYADPTQSADAQAAFVVRTVGSTREQGNLGIALDLESTGGLSPSQLASWAHAFMDGVERRTGRVPILYTYVYFWQHAMANNRTFGAYPLWLARWSSTRPAPLAGWTQWTFWQHSSTSHLPGIPGEVDHNIMCCSAGTLTALADGRSSEITKLWRRLGGASGTLGLPLGPETPVPGGWGQTFQHGFVATTKAHGTFAVLGPVYDRYRAAGGASGALGVPTGAQQSLGLGVSRQTFLGGQIIYSVTTGAHAIQQPVLTRWLKDGGARSQEGLPIAERSGAGQQFRLGGLYRTKTGVHLVPGAIRDRYEALGGPASALGLPTSEATLVLNTRVVQFDLGNLVEITVGDQHLVV